MPKTNRESLPELLEEIRRLGENADVLLAMAEEAGYARAMEKYNRLKQLEQRGAWLRSQGFTLQEIDRCLQQVKQESFLREGWHDADDDF